MVRIPVETYSSKDICVFYSTLIFLTRLSIDKDIFCFQVNTSIYSYHIKNWLRVFDMKKMCFVDGDALAKDPYSVVKKLEKCLKLRDFITSKHFYYDKKKGFYCPVDEKFIPKCLGSGKGRTHPDIDKNVEMKLRKFFEPYNKELFNLTGIHIE